MADADGADENLGWFVHASNYVHPFFKNIDEGILNWFELLSVDDFGDEKI